MERLYYDPETGFKSTTKFYKMMKNIDPTITLKRVQDFIKEQKTAQIHHEQHLRKEDFREIKANYFFEFVQMDLMDMTKESIGLNHNYRYLLILIDVYTRYLWVFPSKSKRGAKIANLLGSWLRNEKRAPEFISSDLGSEFRNPQVRNLFRAYNIKPFHPKSEGDKFITSIAERVIRTLRNLLKRAKTGLQTKSWTHIIDKIVKNYNESFHRTLGRTPLEQRLSRNLPRTKEIRKPKVHSVNDLVRYKLKRSKFGKGDVDRWSKTIYRIVRKKGDLHWLEGKETPYRSHELLSTPIEMTGIPMRSERELHLDRIRRSGVEQPQIFLPPIRPRRLIRRPARYRDWQ